MLTKSLQTYLERIGKEDFLCITVACKCHYREERILHMAETSGGKKKVYVHSHTKEDGTEVRTHYRSTPNTSSGKKNK